MQLTERDLAIVRDVVRFGALTIAQLGRRHFATPSTAVRRLGALADAGYLRLERVWYRGPGVYLATAAGTKLADVGLPAARLTPATLGHHLAVADLADHLLEEQPGSSWVTERELRRDGMAKARDRGDGRLLDGVPHVPDGVLVLADGRKVAVELEASPKRQAAYRRIFAWYAASFEFAAVWWFCPSPAVEARLRALVARERLDDLVAVAEAPPRGARGGPRDRA